MRAMEHLLCSTPYSEYSMWINSFDPYNPGSYYYYPHFANIKTGVSDLLRVTQRVSDVGGIWTQADSRTCTQPLCNTK